MIAFLYLKYGVHALIKEDVQNVENEKEWEFGSEECQEPLRGVHVVFNTVLHQMIPQIG